MQTRCERPVVIGPAMLEGYRLCFSAYSSGWGCGVADIIPENGFNVWGLLYSLEEADMKKVDRYEGHPSFYRRVEVEVSDVNGKVFFSVSYEVVEKKEFVPPSKEYLNIIKHAAEQYRFPQHYRDYLESVSTKSDFEKDSWEG